MRSLLKNISQYVKLMFYGIFHGAKSAEDTVFHQNDLSVGDNTSIIKQVQDNRVSKALLRGEVTQEVENLRYRTYFVDKEAKEYEYYTPTLSLKRDKIDTKFIKYDGKDGTELVTMQLNDAITDGLGETLSTDKFKSDKYRVQVKYNFIPKFKFEQFISRIDVKKDKDENIILDVYTSQYAKAKDLKTYSFLKEIKSIKEDNFKSDILDIKEISFVTKHAYKEEDLINFVFNNLIFKEIVNFDGHYIIRFSASLKEKTKLDLTEKYFSKDQDMKYKKKEKKKQVIDFTSTTPIEEYVCQECGKKIFFNEEEMNALGATQARLATEEKDDTEQVSEYLDMQIAEQTLGKRLCSECLKKYLNENKLI